LLLVFLHSGSEKKFRGVEKTKIKQTHAGYMLQKMHADLHLRHWFYIDVPVVKIYFLFI
jgi:hypothetical protein